MKHPEEYHIRIEKAMREIRLYPSGRTRRKSSSITTDMIDRICKKYEVNKEFIKTISTESWRDKIK